MRKISILKNISNGLLSSFISRNNDVYGYWGIGKLYSLMVKSKSFKIEIDLIRKEINPRGSEFDLMISKYADYLFNQMKNKNIEKENLSLAKLVLIGYPNTPTLRLGRIAPHKIECTIYLIYNSIETSMKKEVWCREHNPKLELKSTRIYIL